MYCALPPVSTSPHSHARARTPHRRVPRTTPHGSGVRFDRGVPVFDATPPVVTVTHAKFAEALVARVEGAAAGAAGGAAAAPAAPAATWRPRHVEMDKVVLRFDMYYKESVEESALEAARVRYMKLLYYVADDTAQLNEPKSDCSGMEAGCFVKRHKLPKARRAWGPACPCPHMGRWCN
jgi:hypothetical protein